MQQKASDRQKTGAETGELIAAGQLWQQRVV